MQAVFFYLDNSKN